MKKIRGFIVTVAFGCAVSAGAVAALYAADQGKLDVLEKSIQDGRWTEARDVAKPLTTADATSAVPAYVMDIVSVVVADMKGRLSEYQFPYSDKKALFEIQAWTEALLKKTPHNANVLFMSAMVYLPKALADTSKFVDLLEQANTESPDKVFILAALGAGYGAQGKYDEAIATLQKATQIDPRNSSAWTNLGVAFLKKGDTEEAEKALKKAVEANSLDGSALLNLGSYYAQRNMNEEARPLLERAIQCNPQSLEARWNLGGIYFGSGEKEKAIEQLKEMIRIAPESPMGRQAQQMLSQLGG